MEDAYFIDIDWSMVLSGVVSLFLAWSGWFVRAYFKRSERATEELNAKIDATAARLESKIDKIDEKIDQNYDKTDAKIDATAARLESKIDKTNEKIDQNHDKTDAKIDATADRLESKIDKTDEKIDATADRLESKIDKTDEKIDQNHDRLDGRHDERHRETQTALLDLNYSVGRLEGAGGIQGGSGDRSGRPSLRRNSDPPPTSGGAREPERIAERHDRSMVPLAGVLAEPATATGLARQAVPGQEQADQQGGETGPEPHGEESPDTAK